MSNSQREDRARIPSADELRRFLSEEPESAELWVAAIHEAGHCIVSLALERGPLELRIAPRGDKLFSSYRKPSSDPELDALYFGLYSFALTHRIATLAAGHLAETIAFGVDLSPSEFVSCLLEDRREPPDSDIAGIVEHTRGLAGGEAQTRLLGAHAVALRVLRECWDEVALVAATLHRRRALKRQDVLHMLAGGCDQRSVVGVSPRGRTLSGAVNVRRSAERPTGSACA